MHRWDGKPGSRFALGESQLAPTRRYSGSCTSPSVKMDTIIRNGTIVDGTGEKAPFVGDVCLKDGLIAEVTLGPSGADGAQEVDATGHIVTPGWVDIHTHYDGQVTWDPYCAPSSNNGVTTVVFGNCGVGFAPCHKQHRDFLVQLMEGVEDIPGAALVEGIQWNWESWPEYLDDLETKPAAMDFGALIGHGPLKCYVMGERCYNHDEELGKEDLQHMKDVVRQAVAAGAMGFSTSRILGHRGADGNPLPGTFALERELRGICEAVKEGGGGVSCHVCTT